MEKELIMEKMKEFHAFLESINITELRKNYTREELKVFQEELETLRLRSLSYEVAQLIEEMKKEEYPELIGIHHYPDIKEMDFLSENEKLALDEYLLKFTPHQSFVTSLWRVIKHPDRELKAKEFLLQKGILDIYYYVFCPHGCGNRISKQLTEAELNTLKTLIEGKASYEEIEKYITLTCYDCNENIELDQLKNLRLREFTKLIKERDKTYDNL